MRLTALFPRLVMRWPSALFGLVVCGIALSADSSRVQAAVTLPILTGSLAAPAAPLKAGAFAQDITPLSFPISVNGNMTNVRATRANDQLHARCLVLDDGTTALALVVCDSCMIPREVIDSAKAQAAKLTAIPTTNIFISATHSHSCPAVGSVFQTDAEVEYAKFLAEKIALGIQTAHQQRAEAKVGFGQANDPTQIFNRRWKMKPESIRPNPFGKIDQVVMNPGYGNPGLIERAGPVDPQISLLSVQTPAGQPVCLFANYGLHYVGGTPPNELSADYFGAYAERMSQLLGATNVKPPFMAAMTNGTSGDVNNIDFSMKVGPTRGVLGQIKVVSESVSQASFVAYQQISYQPEVSLKAVEKDLTLKVRKPTAEELQQAKDLLAKAGPQPYRTMPEVYARETVLMAEFPDTVPVRVQAMRVGDIAILGIPCEVFAEIGLELKQKSPFKSTFVISLANGYNGYLPTPEQHAVGGYETWRARSSYLEEGASTQIVATLLELLAQLK